MAAKKKENVVEEEVTQESQAAQETVEKDPLAEVQSAFEEEKNKFYACLPNSRTTKSGQQRNA